MSRHSVVLVVEDEADSRETLRDLLGLHGFTVDVAETGVEALQKLAELGERECVMLLDLYMPVMDGWQVVEHLRSEGSLERVHVIITTSAPHKAPADLPVLTKPLDIEKLLAIVHARCSA
jgi:CheY-like chemotaxis protein